MKREAHFFVIIFLLIFINSPFSQITFQKTYGGAQDDVFYSVQQTFDGGFIMAGCTNSFGAGGYDVYLVKTDSTGDTLWTKIYGGIGFDFGYCVQQTSDSGYIIIGSTDSNGSGDQIYLIKTNINGDSLWTKTYLTGSNGQSVGWSVTQTFDEGYILYCTGGSDYDAFLIKTDAVGDTLWTKSYGIAGGPLSEVMQTTDSGYIFIGTGTNVPFYLVKTDFNGNSVWKKEYKGFSFSEGHEGYSVKQTPDGGYIASGSAWATSWDVYLVKTNSFGDTLWTKSYGGDSAEGGSSIFLTADADYIIAGTTLSFGAGGSDVYLIKTDSVGDTLWTKAYGGIYNDGSVSVQQTSDGGYILAGSANRMTSGTNDAYLIKTDANGNSGCYENSTATIVSSTHTIVTPPIDTLLLGPILINSYSAVVGSGGTINTLCITTGINAIAKAGELSIYPNPAQDIFSIYLDGEFFNANLEIRNILGEIIYSAKLESKQKIINSEAFSSGIYFVSVMNGSNIITKKLIINN